MKTIHRNKIRSVVANLVTGCKIEIFTQRAGRVSDKKHPRLISFGCNDGSTVEYKTTKYYISQNGTQLTIDTFYDEKNEIHSSTPHFFKIVLPEGCHLTFKYLRAPLSWELEVYA